MHFKYWSLYLTAWRFSTGLTRVLLKLFGILQEPDGIPLPKLKQPINYIDKAAQIVTRVSSSRQTWYKDTNKDFVFWFDFFDHCQHGHEILVWCTKLFKQLQLKKDALKQPKHFFMNLQDRYWLCLLNKYALIWLHHKKYWNCGFWQTITNDQQMCHAGSHVLTLIK